MPRKITKSGNKDAVVRKMEFYGRSQWSVGLASVWLIKLTAGGIEKEYEGYVKELKKFLKSKGRTI